jgi:hypothetical protein
MTKDLPPEAHMNCSKMIRGGLAALTLVAVAAAGAGPASAQYYYKKRNGISPGAAAAVGVVGGLALGAAIAGSRPAYGYGQPAYGYEQPSYGYAPPPPTYYAPQRRVYVRQEQDCFVRRQRVWVEGWGWETRRVRVCEDY